MVLAPRWFRSLPVIAFLVLAPSAIAAQEPNPAGGQDSGSTSSEPGVEPGAVRAAGAWLELLDGEQYTETWRAAAERFRAAIDEQAWSQQAASVRRQVGAVVSRRLVESQALRDPPNAPPGRYLTLTYRTSFREVSSASEVVVLVDEEGQWKVAGYFVRPAPDSHSR